MPNVFWLPLGFLFREEAYNAIQETDHLYVPVLIRSDGNFTGFHFHTRVSGPQRGDGLEAGQPGGIADQRALGL